jgi:hypothetical protein
MRGDRFNCSSIDPQDQCTYLARICGQPPPVASTFARYQLSVFFILRVTECCVVNYVLSLFSFPAAPAWRALYMDFQHTACTPLTLPVLVGDKITSA